MSWIDAMLEEGERIRRTEFKLSCYEPYPRQKVFHAAGAEHRERLLIAANRIGKTHCGAAEMAPHLKRRHD
jgi:hypothetical protein